MAWPTSGFAIVTRTWSAPRRCSEVISAAAMARLTALSYYQRGQRDAVFDIRTLLQFADAVGIPRPVLLPLILADPDAALTAGPWPVTDLDTDGCGVAVPAAGWKVTV